MRGSRFIVSLLVSSLALVACNSVKSGEVIEKIHEEAHTYTYLMPIPNQVCSGNPPTCTTFYTYIPMVMRDDEDWKLKLRNEEGEEGTVEVPQEYWDATEVGDYFEGEGEDDPDQKLGRA